MPTRLPAASLNRLFGLQLAVARDESHAVCRVVGGELARRYPTPESVPEDLARCIGSSLDGDGREADRVPFILGSCCWLAQVEAEALFPPADFMQHWHVKWQRFHSEAMIKQHCGHKMQKPVRAPERQGRNERCKCGSGRKFKVCCAG